MKIIPFETKLIKTSNPVANSLTTNEKNLLSLFGEVWYDNNEYFTKHFIDELFKSIRNDPHIKGEYCPSSDERKVLMEALLKELTITKTTDNKKKIRKYLKTVITTKSPKFNTNANNVVSRIANSMCYDMNTLVILKHPEEYLGATLDDTCMIGQDHPLLHQTLRHCIGYYETTQDCDAVCELDPDKFSFSYLQSLGICFGFELPIFKSKTNINIHQHYWGDFMKSLYTKILDINNNINIVTVGCSESFKDLIDNLTYDNHKRPIHIKNLYKYDSFNLEGQVVNQLGEYLGYLLAKMDKNNFKNNSKDKIMKY